MKLLENLQPESSSVIPRNGASKYKATYRNKAGEVVEQLVIGSHMTAWNFCEKKTRDNPNKDFTLIEL